jgi:hypothetical protein
MTFAIAMTLVVLISVGLLLYQFYTGALLEEAKAEHAEPSALVRPETAAPVSPAPAHRAA